MHLHREVFISPVCEDAGSFTHVCIGFEGRGRTQGGNTMLLSHRYDWIAPPGHSIDAVMCTTTRIRTSTHISCSLSSRPCTRYIARARLRRSSPLHRTRDIAEAGTTGSIAPPDPDDILNEAFTRSTLERAEPSHRTARPPHRGWKGAMAYSEVGQVRASRCRATAGTERDQDGWMSKKIQTRASPSLIVQILACIGNVLCYLDPHCLWNGRRVHADERVFQERRRLVMDD